MISKKILSVLMTTILLFCLLFNPKKSLAYYGAGGLYGGLGMYGLGGLYGGLYGGGLYGGLYGGGLYGSVYGLGGLYGGGLYGGGLYGSVYGLGGLYGGMYGLGSLYGGGLYGGLYGGGMYGLGGLYSGLYGGSMYGGIYGLGGIGGLSGLGGLGGLYGMDFLSMGSLLGNLGLLNTVPSTPAIAAEQTGTWVGTWINEVGVTGDMTLDVVEDPLTGAATGYAVLVYNTFLGAGVQVTGSISNNLVIFEGAVPWNPKPVTVELSAWLDSPIHMNGTYRVTDYVGGNIKVLEIGTFDLTLLPSLVIDPVPVVPAVTSVAPIIPAPATAIVPPIPTPIIPAPIIPLPTATIVAPLPAPVIAPLPTATIIAPLPAPVIAPLPAPVVAPIPATTILAPALTATAIIPPVPTATVPIPTAAVSALLPFPLFVAEQTGTWFGIWINELGVTGDMTMNIVEDPFTGAATGYAVLVYNAFLGAGAQVTGSISNNLVIFEGAVPWNPKPVTVELSAWLDSPIHMNGTYRVTDYVGGSIKVLEAGTFDLSLLPSLALL